MQFDMTDYIRQSSLCLINLLSLACMDKKLPLDSGRQAAGLTRRSNLNGNQPPHASFNTSLSGVLAIILSPLSNSAAIELISRGKNPCLRFARLYLFGR